MIGTGNAVLDRAIAKARLRILPFLILMYILAFIDRSNVGFAKNVLQTDAGLGSASYAFGASIFFIGYAVCEVPSNLMMYRIGARVWLSRIMVTWGIVAACMALVEGPRSFYLVRFLLGVAEAGFFPGVILYLTQWFPRSTRAQIIGIFYFGLPLSLICGGPLSGMLLDGSAPFGLQPWQFMFAVEGLLAALAGVVAFYYLTDRPEQAKWLDGVERVVLAGSLAVEDAERRQQGASSVVGALVSVRVLILCLIYFTVQASVYGVIFYLPTSVAALMGGHIGTMVGLVTAIPWLAAIVVTLGVTRIADRSGRYRIAASAMLGLAALGMVASVLSHSLIITILALCCAAAGFVSVQPLFWTLPTAYLSGAAAAAGIGLINAIGNLGGFVAPNLKTLVDQASSDGRAGMVTLASIAILGAGLLLVTGRGSAQPRSNS